MTVSTSLQPPPLHKTTLQTACVLTYLHHTNTKSIRINNIHIMSYIYIDYWLTNMSMSKSKSTIFKWISNQVGLHPGPSRKNPVSASNPIRRPPWNSPSCSRWKGRRSVPWASSRCWCDLPDRFFRRKQMGKHPVHPESVTDPCTMDGHLHRFIIDLHTMYQYWHLVTYLENNLYRNQNYRSGCFVWSQLFI